MSSFNDVAVRTCQLSFKDDALNRLHCRDKSCLARTELITIWKASLFLILLLFLDHRSRFVLLIKLCLYGLFDCLLQGGCLGRGICRN